MNSRQISFSANRPEDSVLRNPVRLFYTTAAALLLVLMFLGFQQFYLHGKAYPGRELAPPIRSLLILHGIGMSAWVLLFLVQPLLIVTNNRRIHRMLGRVGAGLAAVIVILGFRLGIESTLISPPELRIWGLAPKQFMTIPIVSILIFAGFVFLGVWHRRRPEVHRPMMLLATLAAMPAAVGRIDAISDLYRGTIWESLFGPSFASLVVGALFLLLKWRLAGSLSRPFALGYAGLVAASAGIMRLATTPAWDGFASYLLR
jgi:small basic protein